VVPWVPVIPVEMVPSEAGGDNLVTAAQGEDPEELDELSRRLGFLQHIDEPDRLRCYRDIL